MKYEDFEKRLKVALDGVSANEVMAFFENLGYEFEDIRNDRHKQMKKAIQKIIEYPKGKDEDRMTEEGYPSELVYDEWVYNRMVDSYRGALRAILKDFK